MGQLYGSKWASQEGGILTESGQLTPRFTLWCRKTESLTNEAWALGFQQIEHKVKEAGREGKTVWPPSYAEFLGFCEKPPGSQALKYFPPLGIEDKTTREKRRQLGMKKCSELKNLFE